MTAQAMDEIIVRGRLMPLAADPLGWYIARLRKSRRPTFARVSTACARGYVCRWEIRDGYLWLLDLHGYLHIDGPTEQDWKMKEVRLVDVFPKWTAPVRADWVDDTLRCPCGIRRTFVYAGWASQYERDHRIEVYKGAVVGEWLVVNPPEPALYSIDPDGRRTRKDGIYYNARSLPDPVPPDEEPRPWHFWHGPGAVDEIGEPGGWVIGGEAEFGPLKFY